MEEWPGVDGQGKGPYRGPVAAGDKAGQDNSPSPGVRGCYFPLTFMCVLVCAQGCATGIYVWVCMCVHTPMCVCTGVQASAEVSGRHRGPRWHS